MDSGLRGGQRQWHAASLEMHDFMNEHRSSVKEQNANRGARNIGNELGVVGLELE